MRGFAPAPHKGHRPLTRCRILQYVSCKHCSDAAKEHAHTLSQGTIETLRVGCATGARPRAGRCETPPTGCFASGENDKKEAVRECILSAALFFVFIAPVGSLSVPLSNMRKKVCRLYVFIAGRVQGQCPWCGGTGAAQAPASFSGVRGGGEEPPASPFLTTYRYT